MGADFDEIHAGRKMVFNADGLRGAHVAGLMKDHATGEVVNDDLNGMGPWFKRFDSNVAVRRIGKAVKQVEIGQPEIGFKKGKTLHGLEVILDASLKELMKESVSVFPELDRDRIAETMHLVLDPRSKDLHHVIEKGESVFVLEGPVA